MSSLLHGKSILVTREKDQAKEFVEKILVNGGTPVEVPLLKISCKYSKEQEQIINRMETYNWLFFTSANGVHCFFKCLNNLGIRFPELKALEIAVVGDKTAHVLEEYGYSAQFIPSTYNADVMAHEFIATHANVNGKVLVIKGNRSRDVLQKEFSKKNIPCDNLEVYETNFNYQIKTKLNELCVTEDLDFLTFTSPSTVEAFIELKNDDRYLSKLKSTACVCIGTTTENKAMELGFTNTITPSEFTTEGMIDVIRKIMGRDRLE
ncbi:uroporphyrinogen-III synthase [Virgibacillus byunsanensis]|uniref:Uroporphyrinogen-III synthase n=1 Tax=Virgibacillus byunsanensis TaxID=570945 RepID=A0ABW3LNZ1_9BACI